VTTEPTPSVDFGAAVAEVVRSIPAGRVMTYGDVAAVLGSRASRAVGKVMAHEGADLPWWRVVRSGGHPPVRHEARALEHYRAEGTPLVHGASAWRLDMRRARWSPEPGDPSDDVTDQPDAHRASRPGRADSGPDRGYDPTDPGFPVDPF
jgi:alkylated DNA nucleotide flippase Atl1